MMKRMSFFHVILTAVVVTGLVACNAPEPADTPTPDLGSGPGQYTPQDENVTTKSTVTGHTVIVDLSVPKGKPRYFAAGFLHGLSEDCSRPGPAYFDVLNPKNFRGGSLGGHWIDGKMDENLRMLKTYYEYLGPLGVTIDYLLMDAWGSWWLNFFGGQPIRFPGDNDDWADYETFCKTIATFVRDNGLRNFQYNIWNEPNLVEWRQSQFWTRPRAQFYEMWKRGVRTITSVHPEAVISGPDYAEFNRTIDWKTDVGEFLDFCKEHDVMPQVLTLHALPGDPVEHKKFAADALAERGITGVEIYINEYAHQDEQTPGPSAWYIARIERAGVRAGRAIWPRKVPVEGAPYESLSGELNGLMVLSKNERGELDLSPAGNWWVYKRYAEITGVLVETTASKENTIDAVAGLDHVGQKARILLGANGAKDAGTVTVKIRGFEAMPHWKKNGKVRVMIEKIPYNNGLSVEVPEVVGNVEATIKDGEITVEIDWENPDTAYAVTLE